MQIFLFICFSMILICIYFLFRIELVRKCFNTILNQLDTLVKDDIHNDRSYRWRIEEFEKIPYEKVLFTFWKEPIDMFKGKRFLKPGGRKENETNKS